MTLDFQTNKKIAEEVAIIPSKRLRNKIAGFATVSSLQTQIINGTNLEFFLCQIEPTIGCFNIILTQYRLCPTHHNPLFRYS